MACPKMDWGGTSRLPPQSSPSIDRTTQYISWLVARVDKFRKVFGSRVKDLKLGAQEALQGVERSATGDACPSCSGDRNPARAVRSRSSK
jgi:hypothetical protein